MKRKNRVFMCDFETTVFDGQDYTEVWASASVELGTEDVNIFHSIGEQLDYFVSLKSNIIAYYHNLKFDGSFWLHYLLIEKKLEQAYDGEVSHHYTDVNWLKNSQMQNGSFKYTISEMGQWYTITIKLNNHIIEIRDSLKLLPFSVERIGKNFGTKHKKLNMEYKGFRYAGCVITDEEKEYIKNDVLVVKEALEIMFSEGHNKLTIGSCCLSEYKNIVDSNSVMGDSYRDMFPNMYDIPLKEKFYGKDNVGDYIRKSYRGGWCYLVKGRENKLAYNGTTADVNSLYPSMMHSESGNRYPIGLPYFWLGNYIPDEAFGDNKYYFVRIKTRFYIKDGMLPFIQIKGNCLYKGTESLETSDVLNKETGEYYTHYVDTNGNEKDTSVILTLTMTDFELIKEHYHLVDFEILDGCWFYAKIGIFDEYIDKYRRIKVTSKGVRREISKLFLNNLYGKMSASPNSSFKVASENEDGIISFEYCEKNDKKPGYIPVGSAITSYARNFTIRAAQKNYHGANERGFIYADTDSIHCDLEPSEIVGINVHETAFCCWKLESQWDEAIFTRQKTYIEHITHEDCEKIEKPYHNIKCAGMPKKCKDLFELSMSGNAVYSDEYNEEEKKFLFDENKQPIKRDYSNFKKGLKVPGKLLPKRIKGGILLVDTTYEMRY